MDNYSFKTIDLIDLENFSLTFSNGNYLQSRPQAQLLQHRGWKVQAVGVENGQQVLVAATLLSWKSIRFGQFFLVDGGPLVDFSEKKIAQTLFQGMKEFAYKNNALYLEIAPNISFTNDETNQELQQFLTDQGFSHVPFHDGWSTDTSPEWEYVKDLTEIKNEQQINDSYEKNANYFIKKTEEFGVEIYQLSYNDLEEFKRLTQSTADRLHYHDKDLDFYQTAFIQYNDAATFLFAKLNLEKNISFEKKAIDGLQLKIDELDQRLTEKPNNKKWQNQVREFSDQLVQHEKRIEKTKQLQKEKNTNEIIIAGAMFLNRPQETVYLYSGSYEEYKRYYGPYAIQNFMINKTVKKNIPLYNFYGISGKFDGSDGVYEFKKEFGGYSRQKIGTYKIPIRRMKYALYSLLKKLLRR